MRTDENTARIKLITDQPGLTLKRLTSDDIQAYYDLIQSNGNHLGKHQDFKELREAAVDELAVMVAKAPYSFGIYHAEKLIGEVSLNPKDPGIYVLGYWLDERSLGRGYATGAARTLIAYARERLRATDLYAGVTHGNDASSRILIKLGFEQLQDMGTYTRFHLTLL